MDVGVNYTVHRGSRKTSNGSKLIYYCRRSSVSRKKAEASKRAEKSQGMFLSVFTHSFMAFAQFCFDIGVDEICMEEYKVGGYCALVFM